MTEVVTLSRFSLLSQGPTISLSLAPGQSLAILGPPASGKSRFLRCLSGEERPHQGTVHVLGKPAVAGREGFSKRSTPQSILRQAIDGKKSAHTAEALTATGLWDLRQSTIGNLSSTQLRACELLSCLGVEAKLLMLDGHLDCLDPWTLSSVMSALRKRLASGSALVVVTHRPELLPQFDSVLVFSAQRVVYGGSVDGLLKKGPASEVEIESKTQAGVRGLTGAFKVGVRQQGDKMVLHAEEGQELAAKLLLEGYGDVEFVVLKQPSHEQALMHLTKTPLKKLN